MPIPVGISFCGRIMQSRSNVCSRKQKIDLFYVWSYLQLRKC